MKTWTLLLALAFVTPQAFAQKLPVKGARKLITPPGVCRVKGSDISAMSAASKRWGEVYKLNAKYLQEVEKRALSLRPIPLHTQTMQIPQQVARYFRFVPTDPVMSDKQERWLEDALQGVERRTQKVKDLRQESQDAFSSYTGERAEEVLAEKLAGEKLIFVGEIHGQVAPRKGIAKVLKNIQAKNPGRKIVLFAEAVYLRPVKKEPAFPHSYARSESETVEEAWNVQDATSPNARLMQPGSGFRDMFMELNQNGIEIFPVEDAVVSQTLSAQGSISTVQGLARRNRGFARVIRAQMQRIRAQHPDALFVFFGGMSHVSWNMPMSLPRFFAQENPVVVEAVADEAAGRTFSVLNYVWKGRHSAFTSGGSKRMFEWKDSPHMSKREWGKTSGLDYRIVFP